MLVVALMSLNTMTRMIEEERSEIGTLKSLGYSNFKIILSYIIYVSIATVFGTIIGFVLGNNLIPRIIYSVYTANYILPELILSLNILMFNSIFFTAIILMLFVTIFTCTLELKTTPASLLRPIPPKMGKKILLERVNFIWKRLSFTWKVTIRNMFRYKKRVFMTLIGIAGCTALLLTGFGIRDSVTPISKKQYGEIFKYDDLIVLDEVHRIGDQSAAQTQGLLKLKNAKYKIGMTGTLITNTPLNTYAPLKWLDIEKSSFTNFKYFYCDFGGTFNRIPIGYKNMGMLKEIIDKHSLRKKKDDPDVNLGLPPKTIINEYVDMKDDQTTFYENIKKGIKDQIDKVNLNTTNLLALSTRLRQATA